MATTNKLVLVFDTEAGNTKTFSFSNAKSATDISTSDVETLVQYMYDWQIFTAVLVGLQSASIVETTSTDLTLSNV